ncbi:MAG TPA: M28 family peptidase [bacterium]|nr:M28 family peptidase [bacterium]
MSPDVETTVDTVTRAVRADRLQQSLEWFATVRRDTGGPGEARAAAYIADQLRGTGVPVTVHEFDAYLSYPIRATLHVLEPEPMQLRCLTHSFGRSTGPDGIVADLTYLADGNLARGAGEAALIDGLATPVTIMRATRAGCAAVIFANQDRVIHNMIGTTIWGTPGLDQLDRLPHVPVVSVNKESGDALKRLLGGGARVRAKITTEVTTGWTPALLPEARIPGVDEPELFVLVGAHYCSWDVGITDNATGDACLIEMAKVLWEHRAGLKRSVRLCWWPGHSHGRYAGSTWYADQFFQDIADHCLAYHNIDSPGVRGATKYVARHTTAEVERFCRGVIERVTGQANAPIHRPSRAADQSFLANGVPAFSTYPFLPDGHPDQRPWTGGAANAWWWHTEFDTLDKADVEILALDTRVSLTAIVELANAPVLPISHVDGANEIRRVLTAIAEKTGTHLDLSRVHAEAEVFAAAAARLEDAAASARSAAARRPLNESLIRISRILTSVVYSQGGRFQHDPAEWSPIMRATTQSTLAALGQAAGLPQLHGQATYGFLRAQVTREANRVASALRDATREVETTLSAIDRKR